MKQNYFFDTSSLVKLYHKEDNTDLLESIIEQSDCRIVISELTLVEFSSAFMKKVRTNDISLSNALELLNIFNNDCESFYIINFTPTIIKKARNLVVKYGQIEKLVTLDSLQLASALECNFLDMSFISDKKLIEIAQKENLVVYQQH